MDMVSSAMWFAIAFVMAAIITKVARGRTAMGPVCNRPLPPMVHGASIIGVLHTLLKKGFREMVREQYTKLGSVFTIGFFGIKVTFLVGPEVSGHFFQGPDADISHGSILEFTVPMFGKEIGFGVDIATRTDQIHIVRDALKPAKLRTYISPMMEEVEDYFAKWGQEGMVDLKKEFDQLLLLIVGRCLIGKEVRDNMFGEVLTQLLELFDNGLGLINMLYPYTPTPGNRRRDKARAKLSDLFIEIVRSRKSSNRVEADVLQHMIDSKYRDGRSMTDAEVTGLIISSIFAANHTSSTTSSWTGACLLSHPRWLADAVKEQEQLIRNYGQHIDYNILLEMDILHRCIKETLRLHPPMLMILRQAYKSFTVRTKEGDEYEIPKGHTVASPLLFSSHITSIYKDPDTYDPDRFGAGREEDKVAGKFSYTPFSAGRHVCLGETLAYMQIKVIWSHLLRNFELKLESPFPETCLSKLVLEPKGKVMVSYKRRSLA